VDEKRKRNQVLKKILKKSSKMPFFIYFISANGKEETYFELV